MFEFCLKIRKILIRRFATNNKIKTENNKINIFFKSLIYKKTYFDKHKLKFKPNNLISILSLE